MKYWPAILTALVALAVAIPVVNELVPGIRLFERAQASADDTKEEGKLPEVEVERMFLGEEGVTAPAGPGQVAHLTVDPRLQKAVEAATRSRRIPIGGAVLMDLRTGAILSYVSRRSAQTKKDPLTSVSPATDIAKIVTATALVNLTGARAATRYCHRDPGKTLDLEDLIEDREKDVWCPALSEAFGRNLDAPFARMAYRKLDALVLEKTAAAYGMGSALPFDLPVEASRFQVPDAEMGLVHAAVGADHATLSALQGVVLAGAIANRGMVLRPFLVRKVEAAGGSLVYQAPEGPRMLGRAISAEASMELVKMMSETIEIGDGFRVFHDETGHPVLGDIRVAGKTGAERLDKDGSQTTWFVGFAPVEAPEVALATVSENRRGASGNAQTLALDVFRAYFQSRMGAQASPDES